MPTSFTNCSAGRWAVSALILAAWPAGLLAQEQAAITLQGKHITVKYAPAPVSGRKIFGAAVPYGQVWRIGEKSPPVLHTDADLAFYGLTVPKGDYNLYVLPAADKWELIISRQTGDAPYNPKLDVGRVSMLLKKAPAPVEIRKLTLTATAALSARLEISWEDTVASVPFRVDLVGRDREW
ncbi:MAG: DUF2911 domain-containing protein [Candidatus Solibacter sp.]